MKRFYPFIFCLLMFLPLSAKVRIPSVICDGMVIQRESPITIWGWADSNERISVLWQGTGYTTKAGTDGKWEVVLPATEAGGPYRMEINGKVIEDILIGDVFLCSGQSNMELPVRRVTDMFAEEVADYENNMIRHFIVPKVFDFNTEQEDMPDAEWKACTKENVMEFSALAYFFAKAVYERTGVPVGLVNASWGGTPIEAWVSEGSLKDYPHHINEKRLYEDDGYRQRIKTLEGEAFHRWNTALYQGDPGYKGEKPWFSPDADDSGWQEVDMFSKDWGNDGLNPTGGSHWLRKDVVLPEDMDGKEGIIRMGCIVDSDSVYVNGVFVGTTGYQYPPRIYRIPAGVLKGGANNVTVRVISNGGQPSFVPEKPYKIISAGKEVSLEGKWKYRKGAPMPPAPSMMFFYYKPVCLYNAMISPLRNMNFSSVLWYQGESNVEKRNEYADLLGVLMNNWRETFDDEDLPFYIIELADFLHKDDIEGRKAWAEMREQQAKGVLMNSNAVLIRNSDLGEWNDIHPLDKKTLGRRVAEEALKHIMRTTEN